MAITIITADGDPRVRAELRQLLTGLDDLHLIAEAPSARDLLETAAALHPDVAVMALRLPDADGFATADQLLHDNPGIQVVAMSLHTDARYVTRCRQSGISGYLLKDCLFEELPSAVRHVAAGQTFVSHCLVPPAAPTDKDSTENNP